MADQGEHASQGSRKYFELTPDFNVAHKAPKNRWVNEKQQMKGFSSRRDQPFRGLRLSEPPQIAFERERGRTTLRDAAPVTLAIWLISDRLKRLFEALDPEAFVFQKVVVDYSNFPEPGPDYWFAYIIRTLDCVDEEHSVIRYQDKPAGIKNYLALIDVRMRPEMVGSAHAFRLRYATLKLIVDDVIVAALNVAKIRGFSFKPIQK
jgi:hypothetical protein